MLWLTLFKKLKKMIDAKSKPKVSEEYVEFKLTKGGFASVFTLYNRYFVKSFFGLFFTFAFPVLILAILSAFSGISEMLPGIISMSAMSAGITGMPPSIIQLKKSVLLKRIGASPVKASTFTLVIIAYYVFLLIAAALWLLLWALILSQDTNVFGPLGTVTGFFGFLWGNVYNIVLSISFGFMIAAIAKGPQAAQAIGMLLYFPSAFMAGMFISPIVIADSETMNWISRFVPFRYTTMYISESWYGYGGNPFLIHDYITYQAGTDKGFLKGLQSMTDVHQIQDAIKLHLAKPGALDFSHPINVWDKVDHILGYVYPPVVICLATAISIKKFTWSGNR